MTAKAWYDIEAGYDYLYVEYSTDGGANWTQIGAPLDGSSNGTWKGASLHDPRRLRRHPVPLPLPDRRRRAPAPAPSSTTSPSRTAARRSSPTTSRTAPTAGPPTAASRSAPAPRVDEGDRYYIAENRTYVGYDASLQVGPYQFSFALTDPDKVEHFAFEDGLLVWMVDESYSRQQQQRARRPRPCPAGRRSPHPVHLRRRHHAEQPPPAVRRDVRPSGRPRRPDRRPRAGLPDIADCPGLHKQVVVGHGQAPDHRLPLRVADPGPAGRDPGLRRHGRRTPTGTRQTRRTRPRRPGMAPRSLSRDRTLAAPCR